METWTKLYLQASFLLKYLAFDTNQIRFYSVLSCNEQIVERVQKLLQSHIAPPWRQLLQWHIFELNSHFQGELCKLYRFSSELGTNLKSAIL